MSNVDIADKLARVADGLDKESLYAFKVMLAAAAAELMPGGRLPTDERNRRALDVVVSATTRLQRHRNLIPSRAVVYRGKPDWASPTVLHGLEVESASLRLRANRFHDHLVFSNAPFAQSIAGSAELREFTHALVPKMRPSGKANYLYYDQPGFGIEPHLDTEEFSLNAVMLLEHRFIHDPSALVLFPPGVPPQRIHLEPGELIMFFADSVVHARERMKDSESLRIVAFGFTLSEPRDA